MGLGRADLLRAARLSRLRFTEAEAVRLTSELEGILAHIERLLAIPVDVAAGSPMGPPACPATRADEPDADSLQHSLADTAPEWRAGFFTVPRVLPL